ncbi:uncharacterized protein LOC141691534 [Apium graveolens]|uniref:uncharacterized protein LOC141691534 n=1 Tax=Apium graveolens TaxID=4045 RepID=UPI003D79ECB1
MTLVSLPKYSEAYCNGVTDFIQNAFDNFATGSELRCPCKDCSNSFWFSEEDVYDHLVSNGLCPSFVNWVYEVSTPKFKKVDQEMDCDSGMGLGEDFDKMIRDESRVRNGMNNTAKRFYKLVEEGKQPLYPGCEQFTLLGFIVKLYLLKCTHGFTEGAFSGILKLIKEAFPDVNLPSSFKVAKNMIRELGLDYQKIHACPNDCMLYWGENLNLTKCKFCGVSIWKLPKNRTDAPVSPDLEEKKSKVPAKVLRYFPLKPRLQHLFMCKDYSKLMTWHALERTKDGKLRHPADAEGWKSMDANRPNFAADPRNIRLGLAADGINPYRSMNIRHNTWPIILVNYNLPPWLIMKPENLILSTLVPGPVYPGNDIDVYMQPLIAELKELWEVGLQTYDAYADETFMLRSNLLWTISDFPGYAILSGWSTKAERKIFGYKSHDAHFILQYLLQFVAVKNLKPEVAIPLVRLGAFFRGICGKVLDLEEVHKLQEEVIEILCQLEINFPPAFFDIMVHLPVHLCKEVEFGRPVHLRWMFGIERYLGKLKSYVRNRSKPEGSIAEGYLAEECVTFCSRFLTNSRKTEIEKNINVGYPIGSRRNKDGKSVYLAEHVWINAHREHRILYDNEAKTKKYKKERTHTLEFHNWLKAKVEKRTENTLELSNLTRGPQRAVKKFSGYVINGFRFHTRIRDTNCTTQNSGVILTALTTSFASSKDQNPTIGDVIYYGAIEEIIEDDPFVLATQVQQVFYIQDCTEKNLWFVVKKLPKEHNGIDEETDDMLEDLCGPTMHDTELEYPFQKQTDDVTWHKDDIPNENVSSGEEEEDHDDDHDE